MLELLLRRYNIQDDVLLCDFDFLSWHKLSLEKLFAGFLTTGDGTIPGNLGLRDQVAALRWVQENIAAFGGDPNLVTVFGQSAGGASTEFHRLSPLSRGLFHRAVSVSGNSVAPWALAPPGQSERRNEKAANHWDCPTQPSAQFLKCLNSKTGGEITGVDCAFLVSAKAY